MKRRFWILAVIAVFLVLGIVVFLLFLRNSITISETQTKPESLKIESPTLDKCLAFSEDYISRYYPEMKGAKRSYKESEFEGRHYIEISYEKKIGNILKVVIFTVDKDTGKVTVVESI